jgi:calcium-dependent protein kinase
MGNCLKAKGDHHHTKEKRFVRSTATLSDLKETYNIDQKVLGSGSYGKVFKACDKKDATLEIAIKVINKSKLDPDDLESLKNEVKLMQQVDHPNIVKYYETYDDNKYIYLCMELCTGGELFEKVTKRKKPFSEQEAAEVMRDLLKAL